MIRLLRKKIYVWYYL